MSDLFLKRYLAIASHRYKAIYSTSFSIDYLVPKF